MRRPVKTVANRLCAQRIVVGTRVRQHIGSFMRPYNAVNRRLGKIHDLRYLLTVLVDKGRVHMRRVTRFAKNTVYHHPMDRVADRIPRHLGVVSFAAMHRHAYVYHTLRRTVWVMVT